ncbi:MAG TPA: RNA polymerase factor sigma-54 [Methylotenera sp.]|nr:RNA polymerase factor sigma-54 [Methylotenera sp.]HPH06207.1 RNA polymerase factor sigma-54 [Methylotenera sp.]HPN00993.1 RNA polymerase factor sigma-54 [Methylotenera sp.]
MKQGLQLRVSQNLSLTPQLQQAIKLLQLSSLELNQEIDLLMQTNPLLERGEEGEDEYGNAADDFDDESLSAIKDVESSQANTELSDNLYESAQAESSASESAEFETATPDFSDEFSDEYGEFSNGSLWDENSSPDDDDSDFRKQETLQLSLREHLLSQLKLMPLSERDQKLTLLLVDSINEDGYLEATLAEIVDEMPLELEIEELELQTALRHIQNLDPIGVGARDLSECLLLQLNAMSEDTPHLALAKLLAKHYLQDLASRDFTKLRKYLGCDEETLKSVQQMITSLNPRPGGDFSQIGSEHYIQHEVVVKKVKGIWIASLNDAAIPKLKINQLYAGILKRNRDSNSQYLQSQMQEAKWMIKNIQQRFVTILRVSQAIVDRQRNFLEYGEVAMKPLVLREIADELELHESTISRVTTNKYMLTPRGIFELKYFFGSSVATDSGGTASATAIRALIKQLVDQENPKKPYSDNQITDLLAKQGIIVARRTIAKYRESLGIEPASLRKTL